MFTGIVEATGEVEKLNLEGASGRLQLRGVAFADDLELGESVAVNGCCLTVVEFGNGRVAFDLLAETLRLTNLGQLSAGDSVNLERAMQASSRLSGHFVQGHVDTTAAILRYEASGQDHVLDVAIPREFSHLLVKKGSITIDGMSLTVAELTTASLTIWITPHTHAVTNLRHAKTGGRVNLEFDMLAKYVERIMSAREAP